MLPLQIPSVKLYPGSQMQLKPPRVLLQTFLRVELQE